MSIEWLKNASCYTGPGTTRDSALTFKEQDEVMNREKKKKREVKNQEKIIHSKIDEVMELLKKAILSEMDELVKKHKNKCRKRDKALPPACSSAFKIRIRAGAGNNL